MNPRLANFRVIDEHGMRYVKFSESPYTPGLIEVWGSMDRIYWTLLESF